ncbi:hypothetical protein ACNJ7E_42405 [Rhodococcus sp. NM-2]|uniref:hypothetical protein n=1 Tax=Rhodococcus sp. NM-2 TaxID=3401174 RepID=UPI003AAD3B3E
MRTEDHDEPAGHSQPTADDGPFTLTVDGEVFTVRLRPEEPGACDYDWESGPNKGYGFSSFQRVAYSGIQDRANTPSAALQPNTIDEHRESIRDFLGQINPETGYIGD